MALDTNQLPDRAYSPLRQIDDCSKGVAGNLHEGRTLAGAVQNKLRVLQRRGKKVAVMLENIFWSQLDDLAREQKTTTTKLVFSLLDSYPQNRNRASLLRCFCLELTRSHASRERLRGESIDLLDAIAACPSPVAVITSQRKISAVNPAFSKLISGLVSNAARGTDIRLTFSEPLVKIQQALLGEPKQIVSRQLGIQIGGAAPHFFVCRFALADRNKGDESLIIIFFESERKSILLPL